MWALRKPILDAHILSLQKKVQRLESEIDDILMEKLRSLDSTTNTWLGHKYSLLTIKKANFRSTKNQFLSVMVRVVGLEPTRYAAQEPKSCVSTNSTIPANINQKRLPLKESRRSKRQSPSIIIATYE